MSVRTNRMLLVRALHRVAAFVVVGVARRKKLERLRFDVAAFAVVVVVVVVQSVVNVDEDSRAL